MADLTELNWDDLRYFLLAAKAGTLAGAARGAGVQHSTIGRRLTALERALGAPLFLRGPEGLSLTPLGQKLLPLVTDVERSVLVVRELAQSRRTRVRVALPLGFISLFAEDLARLEQQHPELTLETVSGGQLHDLKRGEADLALRLGPIQDEELIARKLGEVGWSLYASPSYLESHPAPANPHALAGHKVIAYGAALASMPAAQWLETHAAQAVTVLTANEITTMLDAAIFGVGLALLPCLLADIDPRLVRLTQQVLAQRELSLVYRREARLNEAVRVTVNMLVQATRRQAHQISGSVPPMIRA
jgi:DNA-binding transcriptional LysR family regulator